MAQLIRTIIRPEKLDDVQDALAGLCVSGMTVTQVHGRGDRRGERRVHRGREYTVHLTPRMQLEVVVNEESTEEAVGAIMRAARTGRPGDGMVFVSQVCETFRIRTGIKESGDLATG